MSINQAVNFICCLLSLLVVVVIKLIMDTYDEPSITIIFAFLSSCFLQGVGIASFLRSFFGG